MRCIEEVDILQKDTGNLVWTQNPPAGYASDPTSAREVTASPTVVLQTKLDFFREEKSCTLPPEKYDAL
jgi:hypothetical protein